MHNIRITLEAKQQLKNLVSRTRRQIAAEIDDLRIEPDKRGKALQGSLVGFRSIRAAGQRYRIIYLVENRDVMFLSSLSGYAKKAIRKTSTPL